MPLLRLSLIALALVAAAGCDNVEDEFVALPVVSATLEAGEGLPDITLTRLALLNSTYDPATQALRDAAVEVSLVGADGSAERTYSYLYTSNGVYAPNAAASGETVLAGRTYRLRVVAPSPDGTTRDTLRAETTVPAAITVVEAPSGEVVYGEGTGPTVRISASSTSARRAVYVLSASATQRMQFAPVEVDGEQRFREVAGTGIYGPVPTILTFAGCETDSDGLLVCEEDPGLASGGRSPLVNEDNYEEVGDGTVRVTIPFLAFGFYGPQEVTFYSLDDALVAFVQTQIIQFVPTTISPGEVPNVTTNVENGLGVFGSLAQTTVQTFIREPGR